MNYAPSVGQKFHQDGSVRTFKGNTFICHLDKSQDYNQIIELVEWAQNQFKAMKCADKYVFLPLTSMHMTVFDGVCDQVRNKSHFSSKVPRSQVINEITDYFLEELKKVQYLPNFQMKFSHVYNCEIGGTALGLVPENEQTVQYIKELRNTLSEVTGVRMPNFDSYAFHITLSYKVIMLNEEEKVELENTTRKVEQHLLENMPEFLLNKVDFCEFDNMFEFKPLLTF